MKPVPAFCTLAALVFPIIKTLAAAGSNPSGTSPAANPTPATRTGDVASRGKLATLEQKLLGTWHGGPCVGSFTFHANGTYELRNFTPGNNTLTGTWSLRWDALPPTLALTCKTSDFTAHDPTRHEYGYLGKTREIKLVELNTEAPPPFPSRRNLHR